MIAIALGFATLALASASAQLAPRQDPEPPIFPVEDDSGPIELRGADGATQQWFATRLVDARTGAVLRGRIAAYLEHPHPEPSAWPPIRTADADTEGWVRMRVDDLLRESGLWLVAEAPEYAPASEMRAFPPLPWELEKGVDVPIEVQDAFGRPMAGARVGWHLGCGHTPDVRQVVTDAAGRATFSCVDTATGELWVHGENSKGTYANFSAWRPGRPRLVIARDPAPTWRGIVVDHDGAPRAGVHVGLSEYHRGPWALTDAAGRFVLEGLEGNYVMVIDERTSQELYFDLPPLGVEARFEAPPLGTDPPEVARPESENLVLEIEAPRISSEASVPISFWCAEQRFVDLNSHELDPETPFSANLPPGRYEMRIGGADSPWREQRSQIDVPADGVATSKITLAPRPLVRMWLDPTSAFALQLEEAGDIELVTATWSRSIEDEVQQGRRVSVPDDVAWAVRLRLFDLVRHVPSSAVDARGELELVPPEPHRVRVRFADATGRPCAGSARLEKHPRGLLEYEAESPVAEGGDCVELVTWLGPGRWRLHCESHEDAWRAPIEALEVELPESAHEVVDAGEVRFLPAHERGLVLRLPDGAPAAGARIDRNEETLELDEDGRLPDSAYAGPGDTIEAALDDDVTLPFRAVLSGAGPWELRWPEGALDLEVRDENGDPLESFALHLLGAVHVGERGSLALRGVPIGEHEVIVAAQGFAPARLTLDLAPAARAAVILHAR